MDAADSGTEVVCEFLEAVVHQILFLRRLYDSEIFERERLYGIAVHRSRHPELNAYICEAVSGLKEGLKQGKIQRVVVKIESPSGRAVERYVISLQVGPEQGALNHFTRVEAALRGALLKLQYADACLKPLPEGCSFSVEAHVDGPGVVSIENWVEVDPPDGGQSSQEGQQTLIPIKSASLGKSARIQLHVEQLP